MALRNDVSSPTCAAVVLGAGASRRMGQPKALLSFGNEPLIAHVVRTCALIDLIRSIIVVTGQLSNQVKDALAQFEARIVHNPDFDTGGMISSIKVGLRAIDEHVDAIFIVLGDQPLIASETFKALALAVTGDRAIARPVCRGSHGHPILIGRGCVSEIVQLPLDATLKDYVLDHRSDVVDVAVDDEAVLLDVDTPDDYRRALEMLARRDRSWRCQDEAAAEVAAR